MNEPKPNEPTGTAVRSSDLLAWEVEIHSMRCICFAATKAKAQWLATKSYWDAYGKNGWLACASVACSALRPKRAEIPQPPAGME